MDPTTPQNSPLDPAAQAAIQAAIDKALGPFAAALKAPVTAGAAGLPGAGSPATKDAKDLRLDVPEGMETVARVGWRAKQKYYERAGAMGQAGTTWAKKMKEDMERFERAVKGGYLAPVRKAGQFLSTFEDGGAIWARETVNGELIEFLRAASIVLSLPGLRTVTGYGSKLTYSKETTSVTVEWEGEGSGATASSIKFGNVTLGSHKLIGKVPISNDIMRLGTGDAAVTVGMDLRAAGAEAIDDACLNGTGAGKPSGLFTLTDSGNKGNIAGTTAQNKVDDTLGLPKLLEDAHIPSHGDGVYLLGTTTFYHLAGLRGTDAYVFEGLRNLANPTLHGRPVARSTKLKTIGTGGAAVLGYVQPMHCVFGEANLMEVEVGESGDDFSKDMMTMRLIAYADFGMRYKKAAAWKVNVSY